MWDHKRQFTVFASDHSRPGRASGKSGCRQRERRNMSAASGWKVSCRSAVSHGPSKTWLKSKNPDSEAVRRESEEEWH